MNDFEKFFRTNDGNAIQKWSNYFEVYEKHFSRFKGKDIVLLEIGISEGGSLSMWQSYFGKGAKIIGVDINHECKRFETDNIQVFIGSQGDKDFLEQLKGKIPKVDILIDDGGHEMKQQILTFKHLFHHVKEDGVYLCEDCHTSYWPKYGGGFRRQGTFIEYAKKKIDALNAWHSQEKSFTVTDETRTIKSIHFYDSIVVFEKGVVTTPENLRSGKNFFRNNYSPAKQSRFKVFALNRIEKLLYRLKLPSIRY
jgi:23S rRNA U2552 (ribose-2'-O)-methylase RlmE/FtsJ